MCCIYKIILFVYVDFEWATRLNRVILNSIGLWPKAYRNTYDKFLSNLRTTIAFIFLLFTGIIPCIHSLTRCWHDMMSTIDNLQYTLPLIMALMKLIIVWWKKSGKMFRRLAIIDKNPLLLPFFPPPLPLLLLPSS